MSWVNRIIVLFCLMYCAFGTFNYLNYGVVANNQDWVFHFGQARGEPIESSYWSVMPQPPNTSYQPLYHWLFSFFSFNELAFYFANVLLVCGLIPFLLVKKWPSIWVVLIYFCGISLPHQFLYASTFPNALILVFFLVYLLKRNWLSWIVLTILAFFTHGFGLYLFLVIGFLEVGKWLTSGYWSVGWLQQAQMSWHNFGILLLSALPLPVIYFGFKQVNKKGEIFFGGLVLISFIASFFEFRALCIAQVLLCGLAGLQLEKESKKIQAGFALFLFAELCFYVLEFVFGTWKFIVFN